MNFWISAQPDATSPGSWILVCYDFSAGASSPVTLRIHLDPSGDFIDEIVSAEDPCVQVYVPPGCTGILIVDQSKQSQDKAVAVTP